MKVSATRQLYARVVVDTNVVLSAALIPNSVPAEFLACVLAQSQLIFSEATFAELETRLWKPKFDRYISIERRQQLLRDLRACACWVEVSPPMAGLRYSRDADDDKFIHVGLASGASRLVSGDEDLLVLGVVGELKCITPRAALSEMMATPD